MKRRDFVHTAVLAGAGSGLAAEATAEAAATLPAGQGRVGPKEVVRGKKAVAASQHPIVTDTMLDVLREGGNAADAGVAGCLVQATVQQEMTNHTGTVDFIFWEAKSGKAYELNSSGTLVSGLPPFRPLPPNLGVLIPALPPCACIPGFMPGLKAIHERFGSKPWARLVEPAIRWAEEGHVVTSFEFGVLTEELRGNVYFPAGRELFTPGGFLPQVGDRFRNPELAKTLRRLAKEGPDDFITGEWARQFVAEANRLGWPIKLEHLKEVPPRWGEPLRFKHRDHEILQLSPPERQGVFCAMVLGILRHLDLPALGHYAKSAESLYYFAHALRWAEFELGYLWDPKMFEVPTDLWLSDDHHRYVAQLLKRSKPKVDLTEHVKVTSGKPAMVAAGLATGAPDKPPTYKGSCELSIVDAQGNWVQMMNTLQSGGIPGAVVGGVPMVGSHAQTDMRVGHRRMVRGQRAAAPAHRQHHRAEGRQAVALPGHPRQRARDHPPGAVEHPGLRHGAAGRRGRPAPHVPPRRLHPRDREPYLGRRRGRPRAHGHHREPAAGLRLPHGLVPDVVARREDGPAQQQQRPQARRPGGRDLRHLPYTGTFNALKSAGIARRCRWERMSRSVLPR